MTTLLFLLAAAVCFAGYLMLQRSAASPASHLQALAATLNRRASAEPAIGDRNADSLSNYTDRLGRAGFVSTPERRRARQILWQITLSFTAAGAASAAGINGRHATIGAGIGLYLGILAALMFLKSRQKQLEQQLIFELPLVMEELILLVEAGLGILPAVEKSVADAGSNQVKRLLRLVYELSAHGLPFGQAIELVSDLSSVSVIRHTLLHLDISGTEGGELIPSLRSLSDHAHTEWKIAVERRVKRLENFVVFPVFASVLGLILVTASVPLVPILHLKDSMEQRNAAVVQAITTERENKES